MLKMSFYDGTMKRDNLIEFINNTDKRIVFTYGFEYRHPTTHRVQKTKQEAINIVKNEFYLDADEEDECLHLNAFSDNDMW